jgi:protein SCO1/2
VPARLRLALLAAATIALLAALGAVLLARAGDSSAGDGSSPFDGALSPPGIPVRDFVLRDQDGRRLALGDLRGHVVILTFLYTTCRDTCPLTAEQIENAMDRLGHDVPALAVSVDPAHDTPALAQRFLVARRLVGRMRFLLGTRAQLAPIWKAYGIRPQGKGFEHSAYVLLLDRSGRQRVSWPVDKLTPEGLAHDLRRLEATRA